MAEFMFNLELNSIKSYQSQIKEKLLTLILDDYFGIHSLPSSRRMAEVLGVSRNTVVIVYESLVEENYLVSKARSGFYVNDEVKNESTFIHSSSNKIPSKIAHVNAPKWDVLLKKKPASLTTLKKDPNWLSYPFPFIYGQIQPNNFPLSQWRACNRLAQGKGTLKHWVEDYIDADDSELVSQICQQALVRRGINANKNEILMTLGTQNSMYLLANVLSNNSTTIGCEDPGYSDLRHIFGQTGATIKPLNLDNEGLVVNEQLEDCDYVTVTPSHQYPTTVTMPIQRRKQLLAQATKDNFVIIEDDYESEVNFLEAPLPALKSLDKSGRVIYLGSLSKSLSPGLRIGYIVADKALITQLRAARRLNYRHPPANNQRTLALFFSQGYYDSHVRRMRKMYEKKWHLMDRGLKEYLPHCVVHSTPGSFCFWIELPKNLTSALLVKQAKLKGILVESGDSLFISEDAPKNYIRLGFSAMNDTKITVGLQLLGTLISHLNNRIN